MTPAQDRQQAIATWKKNNAMAVRRIPKELNTDSSIVSDVLAGKRKTRTLQVERRLAELGCPGFEQYQDRTEETK